LLRAASGAGGVVTDFGVLAARPSGSCSSRGACSAGTPAVR